MNRIVLNRKTSGLPSGNTEYCLRHLEIIMVYLKHQKNNDDYYLLTTLRNLPEDGGYLPPAFEYRLRIRRNRGKNNG